jgi:hypothetical protein
MALIDRVRNATGGPLWDALSRFRGYVAIKGAAVAQLQKIYSLQEIVAEGDIAAPSVRMSGFAEATDWCVHPEFVAVRNGDGRFLGARRPSDGGFPDAVGALEEIYLCGLGVWMCMTAPLTLLSTDAVFEELEDWVENGEQWQRLKVAAPACGLAPARVKILYFDREWMMRRADCDSLRYEGDSMTVYCSAFQSFAGLTLPTLYRALRRSAGGRIVKRPPCLDIEIFDATYN